MKCSKWFVVLAAICVLLPFSAFAKQKDKDTGNFTLYQTTQVGDKQLAPGDYKAEWSGTGSTLQVNILKDKQVVATTQAKLVSGNSQDEVTVNDSTKKLEQINFGRMRQTLVLE